MSMNVNLNLEQNIQQNTQQNYNTQEQTERFDNWSQGQENSIFSEDQINAANEFLAENPNVENYDAQAWAKREELMVIMDDDGTLLGQMVDSDHDGKVDTVEYYVQDDKGSMIYRRNDEGELSSYSEYTETEDGGATRTEVSLDEDGEVASYKETAYNENHEVLYTVEDSDGDRENDECIKYEYEYDENGKVIKEILYIDTDGDGEFDEIKENTGEDIKSFPVA